MNAKIPTDIKLHKQSAILEIFYTDKSSYTLSAEFLRVHSPSAEVRGHGSGQEILQTGKREVLILQVEIVGNYAIKLTFDDGHNSGYYSWSYLEELCKHNDTLWQDYLDKLQANRASRDPLPSDAQVINIQPLSQG
ncbi:MAG: DUF971 domain-containing protein [Gammaproteobacteria bacterium]|jgi:DUF971 family protein|nr:DUF971 domain-containing protein [Gammaproteobacteria bacterium]MDP7456024.1 DUF971 domain-containing protein [Gammaproteobacteria bacterium]|tara:strand:- start:1678 stop:2085 length:408 start_codon:yes stop_codon:yes gene_type:complete